MKELAETVKRRMIGDAMINVKIVQKDKGRNRNER